MIEAIKVSGGGEREPAILGVAQERVELLKAGFDGRAIERYYVALNEFRIVELVKDTQKCCACENRLPVNPDVTLCDDCAERFYGTHSENPVVLYRK